METEVIVAIAVYVGLVLYVTWDAALRYRNWFWVSLLVLLTGPVAMAVWFAVRPEIRDQTTAYWMAPVTGVGILVVFLLAGWQYSDLLAKELARGPVRLNWLVAMFVSSFGYRGVIVAFGLLGGLLAVPFLAPLVLSRAKRPTGLVDNPRLAGGKH